MVVKVAFRVDASLQIGSGHVMRCLTLADALQAAGAQCLFVCRSHPGHLIQKIREKHSCVELPIAVNGREQGSQCEPSPYSSWLGETDASQTCDVLRDFQPDWLVVDHYALGSPWERSVQSICKKIFVIDDLANRSHSCALLLDQNLGRSAASYAAHIHPECVAMTGPRFALLRGEFVAARHASLERRSRGHVENILVTMGGADASNATVAVLRALGKSALGHHCKVTVVLGQQNPWYAQVKEVVAALPFQTQVIVNSSEMSTLMAEADLAVGAAGATSWERCCLGLPTVLLTLAANQIPSAVALQDAGAALHIGGQDGIDAQLPVAVERLLDASLLQAMSRAAASVCDGLGVQRVVDQLRISAP